MIDIELHDNPNQSMLSGLGGSTSWFRPEDAH
jgi:hypothetical protein